MLRFNELPRNPVTVMFRDEGGEQVTVLVERLRRGLVNMTCLCQLHSKDRWCKHCLALLCDRVILDDDEQKLAFESIVGGTRLEAAAYEVKQGLEVFAIAYRDMKRDLPNALDPSQLHNFGTRAYGVSMTAHRVAIAIETFIKELRAGENDK